jgi:hypothetical protein
MRIAPISSSAGAFVKSATKKPVIKKDDAKNRRLDPALQFIAHNGLDHVHAAF